jgi:hypothetical protein
MDILEITPLPILPDRIPADDIHTPPKTFILFEGIDSPGARLGQNETHGDHANACRSL